MKKDSHTDARCRSEAETTPWRGEIRDVEAQRRPRLGVARYEKILHSQFITPSSLARFASPSSAALRFLIPHWSFVRLFTTISPNHHITTPPYHHGTTPPYHHITTAPRHHITILLLLLITSLSPALSQVAWTKQGGVCFRIDDNHEIAQYNSFDSLFSIYGYKFSAAVILEAAAFDPEYMAYLSNLFSQGHECMDHSPTHSTCRILLADIADTSYFHGDPWVDHISENLVCYQWESVDTTHIQGEGPVNVYGDLMISVLPGEFVDFYNPVYIPMLFFPQTGKVYTWTDLQAVNPLDPDSLTLLSYWNEPVSLGVQLGIPYHKLASFDVRVPDEVLVQLGEWDIALCQNWDIPRPVNWIQPYGNFPLLRKTQVARVYGGELGYTGGSTYSDESYKTYNEYNPNNDDQYGLMFWDFSTTQLTAKENKELIANGIAKHLLLIDQNHFMPTGVTWHGFLQRTDSLLSWLYANQIPVLTQRQWVPMLYDSLTDPGVNIFPLLQTDLNGNQIPDGYELVNGTMIYNDGVPQSDNHSVQVTGAGTFFQIRGLGGLEKGTNNFSFYAKGDPGNEIWFRISYPEAGGGDFYPFILDQTGWARHTLAFTIPDTVSVANIEMECHNYAGGELRISGMELRGIAHPVIIHESVSIMTNEQFPLIGLDTLIYDPGYPFEELTITIVNTGVLDYELDTIAGTLLVEKPTSFWIGSDSLKVTATNPEGGAGSAWLKFTATQTDICKGQPVTLYLLNPPAGASFLWTANPPDPSLVEPTIANPTVAPLENTTYTVDVTAPGNSYSESISVVVHQTADVTLWGPLPSYCANASPVQLFGDPAGGTFSGPGVVEDYFYPALALTGPNTLKYTATDAGGCEGVDSLVVTIQPIPQPGLPADTAICHWQTIMLDAGPDYDSYLWSTGDMTSYTTVNATGMLPDSTKQVTLIVTLNGCPGFDTTVVHFKACTGIGSPMPDDGCLILFPNPVSDLLTITNRCSKEVLRCNLLDITGHELRSLLIRPGVNTFSLLDLDPGVYLLSVNNDNVQLIRRVIRVP